jgi:hypothetical protein
MLVMSRDETHAVLSFVASGHVVVFDAAKREPLFCTRMVAGAGGVSSRAPRSLSNSYSRQRASVCSGMADPELREMRLLRMSEAHFAVRGDGTLEESPLNSR